jgi:hypothetical protein
VRPRVEFLWWEGCPSHERALAELREAMAAAGFDPQEVDVREVRSEDDAARERFTGSPTIRIDGRDVDARGAAAPPSLTCRIYYLADGRPSPIPSREDLEAALT